MRYEFVQEHRTQWPVRLVCQTLAVSSSGYYAWRKRPQSSRSQRAEPLLAEIRRIHLESRRTYGSPRVHAELRNRGRTCCENTVARMMRKNGIVAKTRRKYRSTTDSNHSRPVAANVLNRQFQVAAANQAWVSDITYVPTREGWLYLATVEDLYSRKIVGWSMSERITSRLVSDAMEMAIRRQLPRASLLSHSDRGSQYASEHYQRLLSKHGIVCSMSRRGNCWDNAPMESFYATLKKELISFSDYWTRAEARLSIFEYIETFYNRTRRHSALGYKTPAEYDQPVKNP